MPSLLPAFAVLGVIMMYFSATMLVPWGVAAWGGEAHAGVYGVSAAATFGSGCLMWLGARWHPRELQPRDGVLLVSLVWTLPLFASLPLWLHFRQAGTPLSFTKAYFEAMSGLTTTGSTVLTGLDGLPASVNLWRCLMQWVGGMGILVLAVAVLPLLGVGGSQLFKAEMAGPMKDTKLTPRITETAKGLWTVYCLLSLLCLLAYRLAGMSGLDAWMHMFTTVSLGGLSSHDASFGYFRSPWLEWIAVVFMLASSCNFALYFLALRKRAPARLLGDTELRATLGVMIAASLAVAALLLAHGAGAREGVAATVRMAFFNVVSVASTTGYATTDYGLWPAFAPVLMLMLSGVATSAGSTGSGIKMVRVLILCQQAHREMRRIMHPRAVHPVTLGGGIVPVGTILSVLGFMLVYGATIIVLTLVLLLTGMDMVTAFSAVVGSVNNMGPGLQSVGPAGHYGGLTALQTWVCTLAMLLGRLEMLSFLVLLSPSFWRK